MKHLKIFLLSIVLHSAQAQTENSFTSQFNQYLESIKPDAIDGYYNIDASQKNMHVFKKFIVALKQTDNKIILYFIDSPCFGYRKYWSTGDIYASANTSRQVNDTIEILLNEIRAEGKKVPVAYDLNIGKGQFQLTTQGGKENYIDHFIKIKPNEISSDFSLTETAYRTPTPKEVRSLDYEYQSGLQLMYLLSKSKPDKESTDLILKSLNAAFDSLNTVRNYPITEYNSVWNATFGLSVVFSNILIRELGWQWIYVEKSTATDVGWTLVSKNKKFGISAEQIFYERIMRNKTVDFVKFYKDIQHTISATQVDNGRIVMLELPCE